MCCAWIWTSRRDALPLITGRAEGHYSHACVFAWASVHMHVFLMYAPAARSHPALSQVNNATARVMTNKKVVNPYTNSKSSSQHTAVYNIWHQDLFKHISVLCFCRLETQSSGRSCLRTGALRRWESSLFCHITLCLHWMRAEKYNRTHNDQWCSLPWQ